MPHHGNNIARLRGLRYLTQKDLAAKLGMEQQDVSRFEGKETLEDAILNKIATALDYPVEILKELDANSVGSVYQQDGNKGHVFNYEINPIEKISELYERRLEDKDAIIASLTAQLKVLKKSGDAK